MDKPRITAAQRKAIQDEIDRLIQVLDEIEGDPDFEPEADDEPDGSDEDNGDSEPEGGI